MKKLGSKHKKILIVLGIIVLIAGGWYLSISAEEEKEEEPLPYDNEMEVEFNKAILEMFDDSTDPSDYNFDEMLRVEKEVVLQEDIEVYIKDDYKTLIFRPLHENVKLTASEEREHIIDYGVLYRTITEHDPDTDLKENEMHGFRIVLLEGITEIGDGYFKGYHPVSEVLISSTIKEIGRESFAESYISVVKMENGVETIGEGAFRDNPLNHLRISPTIQEISSSAFENSFYGLNRLYIPEGVTSIGNKAFATPSDFEPYREDHMKQIYLPKTLKAIEKEAFVNHSSLFILFSDGLESIGEKAFYGDGITFSELPNTLERVENQAFKGPLYGEQEVTLTIPKSIKYIGERAFDSVDARIVFAEGVEDLVIDEEAFYGNISDTIIIPSGVEEIKNGAFYGPHLSLVEIEEGIKTFAVDAFIGSDDLPSITLPESIETFIPAKSNEEIKDLLFAFHHTDFEIQDDKGSELLEKVKESGTGLYEYREGKWIDQHKIEEEEDDSEEENEESADN